MPEQKNEQPRRKPRIVSVIACHYISYMIYTAYYENGQQRVFDSSKRNIPNTLFCFLTRPDVIAIERYNGYPAVTKFIIRKDGGQYAKKKKQIPPA